MRRAYGIDGSHASRPARGPTRFAFVVLAGLALTVALPRPANAGFFDFLFGQSGTGWNPFAPNQGQVAPQSQAVPSTRKHKTAHARPRPTFEDKARRSGVHQPSPDLMDDASLRDGDAVVTPRGIRIFTGASGAHHGPEDFASLSEIKGLPGPKRSALAEIDATYLARGPAPARKPESATGRSAVGPRVEAGTMLTDPKGRTIRYVGP